MTSHESPGETIGGSGIALTRVTVAGLRQALSAGQLSAADIVRFYLDRIEHLNPALGAVISVCAGAADEARAIDQSRAEGAELGPLAGIPVLIKDNISVAGYPGTAGSPALARAAAADAFLIGRLRAAGAVVLGKANLSEWANFRSTQSSSGWSTLGGQAVNPHGTGRNPSGSSSGSAVAVATGLAPLAVGTETDGSIISPAHACGIVGIKPTLGLVSRTGIVPISAEQDTAGPMTRTVADAAALHGAEVVDPVDLAGADKIGDSEFLALRHEFKDDLNAYLAALGGEHPMSLAELITFNCGDAEHVLAHFGQQIFEQAEATSGRSDPDWQPAREQAVSLARSGLDAALTEHRLDTVLALSGNPAWLTDYVLGDHYGVGTSSPAAVSGYPAITVPAGRVSGLPVGISLIGPAWSEPRLIALAHCFEQARGFEPPGG